MSAPPTDAAGRHATPAPVVIGGVRPTPSDAEAAAIAAALEVCWPRSAVEVVPDEPRPWRFSGRWWTKPVAARRDRP